MTYDEAIQILARDKAAVLKAFPEVKNVPVWGEDLGGYCERYLSETIHGKPVFVYNMPAPLKSFYMRRNDDGKTVQGCDLLIPGMGELIGSSIREANYEKLVRVMVDRGMYRPVGQSFTRPLNPEAHKATQLALAKQADSKHEQPLNSDKAKTSAETSASHSDKAKGEEKGFSQIVDTLSFGSLQWYLNLRRFFFFFTMNSVCKCDRSCNEFCFQQ